MPNVIKPKRSAVAGNVPTTAQIGQYEIAMNTADKKIFTSNGTNIIQIAAGDISGLGDVQITSPANGQSLSYNSTTGKWVNSNAGIGDVQGPASSVDNSVVRFDGTTGKLIQGSPITISDTGAISGAESISNIDFAQFDTTVAVTEAVGKLQWDDGNGTLQFGLKGGNVNLQVGQEMVARVYNDSGVALTDGQIVYISGSQGNRIAVKLAKADSEATSAGTLGMVTEPIAIGAEGFITMMGVVNKLNTSGLTAGALIYLSASTAGAYTTTRPTAPNHTVILGYVERVSTTVGSIYVKVDNGYELDELHNVVITTPSNGQTLIYDAVAGVWENSTLTAGTGISVTNGAGTITIANTGVTSITGTANQITASTSTGGVTLSLPATINVNTSGSAASLTTARTINGTSFNGTANITIDQLYRIDDRSIAPADITTGYMKFGFTSWSNNSTAPYADFLHLRSYTDASGGNDNLVMFRKDAIGMRIYQQAYDSATAYSTYKDVAFTDQLPTVNAGTFSVSIGTAGATNTTVTWGTSSGFNANTATNYTYDLKIGPALTNLASTMTGATTGFIKKTGADTYSLDTNTYLTSYTETDTLQSVTSRGNTTTTTIQHGGLVMSAGTNVDQVYTVTDSLTLTTAWQDTSVNAAELATGSYVVQLLADDYAVGGGQYSTYYTGMMSWYNADTNETSSDEIVLHRAGHASNAGKIYLRVLRTYNADVADLKLQISGTTANTGASNYQFKFRRLI